jgi:hypothetical protein
MRRASPLLPWIALIALAAAWGSAATAQRGVAAEELAPDGRRGLGSETPHARLRELFRQPDEEDQRFLAELLELPDVLGVLVETTEGLYRSRGWFALLAPRAEPDLAALHASFAELALQPEATLRTQGEASRALAETLLDTRFRMRRRLLEGWEDDVRDLEGGLSLLRSETDGWSRLGDEEASAVARRVDLAASLLRARVKDLEALREPPGSASEAGSEEVHALLAILAEPDGVERLRLLAEARESAAARVERMAELCFTPRFLREHADLVRWREERTAAARELRAEAELWDPEGDQEGVPAEIQRLRKTERRRGAMVRALSGLTFDPLDGELTWIGARMARIVGGSLQALSLYDRFLALAGIRIHDGRTWRSGAVSAREEEAILYLQEYEQRERIPPARPGSDQ